MAFTVKEERKAEDIACLLFSDEGFNPWKRMKTAFVPCLS
jgi:hypothetical protein